jgi:hypothetical protein
MDEAKDMPGEVEQDDAADQLRNHVICVCERRQLKILTAIGAILLVTVVVVGVVVGTRASSSPSNTGPTSSLSGPGGTTPSSIGTQNMTAPVATPVTINPTNAPTLMKFSTTAPTRPPFTPVLTQDPTIQNGDPMPATPSTGMPVVSPFGSQTLNEIHQNQMLRCGFYDSTVYNDPDNDIYVGFSIELVR